jgi:hypothetical protein
MGLWMFSGAVDERAAVPERLIGGQQVRCRGLVWMLSGCSAGVSLTMDLGVDFKSTLDPACAPGFIGVLNAGCARLPAPHVIHDVNGAQVVGHIQLECFPPRAQAGCRPAHQSAKPYLAGKQMRS